MEENNNGQMVEQATVPKPEEKKKDGSVLGTIFGFIFMGMLVFGFLFMGKFNDFINEHFPKVGQMAGIDRDDTKPLEEKEKVDTTSIVGNYVKKYTNDTGAEDSATLTLRADKTFVYDDSTYGCYDPLVGTYEVENDVINFTGKVLYGCDACYFTQGESINNFSANIVNGKIVLKGEFTKSSETESNSNRYVLEPVNGTTPDGDGDPWLNCD